MISKRRSTSSTCEIHISHLPPELSSTSPSTHPLSLLFVYLCSPRSFRVSLHYYASTILLSYLPHPSFQQTFDSSSVTMYTLSCNYLPIFLNCKLHTIHPRHLPYLLCKFSLYTRTWRVGLLMSRRWHSSQPSYEAHRRPSQIVPSYLHRLLVRVVSVHMSSHTCKIRRSLWTTRAHICPNFIKHSSTVG